MNCLKIRSVRYLKNSTDNPYAPTMLARCYQTYVLFKILVRATLTIILLLFSIVLTAIF